MKIPELGRDRKGWATGGGLWFGNTWAKTKEGKEFAIRISGMYISGAGYS